MGRWRRQDRTGPLPGLSARRAACAAALVLTCAAALLAASAPGGAVTSAGIPVRIQFTGKGGGRYLDITRWLRDDTRDCYARRTADETVAVSWTLSWDAVLVRSGSGLALRAPSPLAPAVAGSIRGKTVRDGCDVADEEVDATWIGSDRCAGPLPVRSSGGLVLRSSGVLALRGPSYGAPPTPCELSVRNDQLAAHAAVPQASLTRVAAGKTVALAVGTAHPGPGDRFAARRFCSAFPHIYDGVVYIYDCNDTLVWKGTVTLRRR